MPRLRNSVTGVVVSVDAAMVKRLGKGWEPVDIPAPTPPEKAADKDDDTPSPRKTSRPARRRSSKN